MGVAAQARPTGPQTGSAEEMAIREIDYHEKNESVAHVTILSLKQKATTMRHTVYRVEHECCGKHSDMTHEAIRRRLEKNIRVCSECRYIGRPSEVENREEKKAAPKLTRLRYKKWYHGWEPPASALAKRDVV